MKSIYIAGGMTGYPDHNFPAFFAAEELWKQRGWLVVNPARKSIETMGTSDADVLRAQTWSFYLKNDLKAMLDVDALAVLPGWENSRGASLEVYIARQLGMDIYEALTFKPLPVLEDQAGLFERLYESAKQQISSGSATAEDLVTEYEALYRGAILNEQEMLITVYGNILDTLAGWCSPHMDLSRS